jgi:oligopeptide transport system ATP-binding protein
MNNDSTTVMEPNDVTSDGPLLRVTDVVQTYSMFSPGVGRRTIQAVSGVSFDVKTEETLALVGESGCGKSTLARCVLQSPRPQAGAIEFRGTNLVPLKERELSKALRGIQAVFQDPYSSIDPHWHVLDIVAEPLRIHKVGTPKERLARAAELLEAVGLSPSVYGRRRPRELSGGQGQRVAIARALALNPLLVVCDEPVSSLDVSVQAQILNLFEDLKRNFGLSYLFITHDLAVAKHVSDRVAVMYLGKMVEIGSVLDLFDRPLHPYSAALLSAIPERSNERRGNRIPLRGDLPSAADPPSGCRFRTRCAFAQDVCTAEEPPLRDFGNGHMAACHFPFTDGSGQDAWIAAGANNFEEVATVN